MQIKFIYSKWDVLLFIGGVWLLGLWVYTLISPAPGVVENAGVFFPPQSLGKMFTCSKSGDISQLSANIFTANHKGDASPFQRQSNT